MNDLTDQQAWLLKMIQKGRLTSTTPYCTATSIDPDLCHLRDEKLAYWTNHTGKYHISRAGLAALHDYDSKKQESAR